MAPLIPWLAGGAVLSLIGAYLWERSRTKNVAPSALPAHYAPPRSPGPAVSPSSDGGMPAAYQPDQGMPAASSAQSAGLALADFVRPWLPITRSPLPAHMTGQVVRVLRRWKAPWEPISGDPLGFRGGVAYASERGPTPGPTRVKQIIARRIWAHNAGGDVTPARFSALHLVRQPGVTPDDVVSAALKHWTPENVVAQVTPAKVVEALSPKSWATPEAVAPSLIQSLAVAAVMAAIL